jgi:hypothetical protein
MPDGARDIQSISDLTKYGLGSKRTLDQLIEFTGLDLRNRVAFKDRFVCKIYFVFYITSIFLIFFKSTKIVAAENCSGFLIQPMLVS